MTSLSSIGPTTSVRGNVHGDGDLEILGRVEGSVAVTGDVTIGEGALIQSDVRGRRVTVRGAVAGNVSGEEAVLLEAGARVVGDLGAPQIGIRPGALVRGNVSTGAPLPAASPGRAEAAAPARAHTPTPRAAPAPAATRRPAPAAAPPPRPAPAPRFAPAPRPAPVARPAPPPAPIAEARSTAAEPAPSVAPSVAPSIAEERAASAGGPPPPVVPAIRKGARAAVRKKGGR